MLKLRLGVKVYENIVQYFLELFAYREVAFLLQLKMPFFLNCILLYMV
jgi:hypothetical protein